MINLLSTVVLITVNEVRNASCDYQKINGVIARTAAASIALHGGWTGTFQNRIFTSFNFFAAGYVLADTTRPSSISSNSSTLAQLTDSSFLTAPTRTSTAPKTLPRSAPTLPNSPSPPYPLWRLKPFYPSSLGQRPLSRYLDRH